MRRSLIAIALAVAALAPAAVPAAAAPADPTPSVEQRRCIAIQQRLADLERRVARLRAAASPDLSLGDLMRDVKPGTTISEACAQGAGAGPSGNASVAGQDGSDAMRKCIAIAQRIADAERDIARAIAAANPTVSLGDLMRDISPGDRISELCADNQGDPAGGSDGTPDGPEHRKCIAIVQRISEAERRIAELRDSFPGITLGDGMRDVKPGQTVSEVCAGA